MQNSIHQRMADTKYRYKCQKRKKYIYANKKKYVR